MIWAHNAKRYARTNFQLRHNRGEVDSHRFPGVASLRETPSHLLESSLMAKSQSRSRRPHPRERDAEQEPQEIREVKQPAAATATAVAEPAPPPPQPQTPVTSQTGEDVSAIDAETNAKYEQIKGGKLYIKDLQQMDI